MLLNMVQSDKELFAQIALGDEIAFEKLFNAHMPVLSPIISQITKSATVAEDIIQETFLRVWINRDRLPEIENPKAWIYKIAYHLSFTYLKKKANNDKHHQKLSVIYSHKLNAESVDEGLAFKALSVHVKNAVNMLPKQQKIAYRLSREQGLKIEEIAKEMSLSPQSVKNTLVRALKFIREQIKKAGFIDLTVMLISLFMIYK